jgi:hypothetical protein
VAGTRARDRQGWISLAVLVGILLVGYAVNFTAPPPPSVTAIGIGALAGATLGLLLAGWVDRHRVNVGMRTGGILQAN